MALKVAFPFRHHASLVCAEAKKMLTDAGFELVCNDTGRILTREEQKSMIQDAYAIIAGTEVYDADMLSACTQLKTIIRFGVGLDKFDLETLRQMGVQVGVIANYNAVAEFALTLMLSVLKNLPRYDCAARSAQWSRFPMGELSEKTVGLVGFGRIGKRLAQLLNGFDVRILVYDPYVDAQTIQSSGAVKAELDALLAASDIVSLHLPAMESTYHLINAETIATMKDGAYLINTSRGTLVDEKALHDALESGKLAGAGVDVYEREPLTPDNLLLEMSNTVLSPHCSALTHETNYHAGITCARSVLQVAEGGAPVYPVE